VDLIPACDEVVPLSCTTITTQLVIIFSMSKSDRIPEVTSATSEPPGTITVTKQENRRFVGFGGKFIYVKVYDTMINDLLSTGSLRFTNELYSHPVMLRQTACTKCGPKGVRSLHVKGFNSISYLAFSQGAAEDIEAQGELSNHRGGGATLVRRRPVS
jgi:hypothetical protein